MNAIADLEKLSHLLPSLIKKHKAALDDKKKAMATLKKEGLIYASEHWREGKYFYLIHPTQPSGERKREYIGTDQKRIAKAKAAMRRAAEYDGLERLSRDIEQTMQQCSQSLRATVLILKH